MAKNKPKKPQEANQEPAPPPQAQEEPQAQEKPKEEPSQKTTEIIKPKETKVEVDYPKLYEKILAARAGADPMYPSALHAIAINLQLGRKFSAPVTDAEMLKGQELVDKMREMGMIKTLMSGRLVT